MRVELLSDEYGGDSNDVTREDYRRSRDKTRFDLRTCLSRIDNDRRDLFAFRRASNRGVYERCNGDRRCARIIAEATKYSIHFVVKRLHGSSCSGGSYRGLLRRYRG